MYSAEIRREQSVSLSEISSASCATPEASLWACVVLGAVRDLCAPGRFSNNRRDVERWIGTFASQDFKLVASLAGYDPEVLWARLDWLRSMPVQDRYNWHKRATVGTKKKTDTLSGKSLKCANVKSRIRSKRVTRFDHG